jgi:SAM-dependent methyltransferase
MGLINKVKKLVEGIPLIGPLVRGVAALVMRAFFSGSQEYWESRYARGGTSGAGSYGKLAEFKAQVLNSFVKDNGISSVIEFGCGDGNQIALADYPAYVGLDVSRTAIRLCKERFGDDKTKRFFLYEPDCSVETRSVFKAELALSLDVIYHLVEDRIFELYMKHLFSAATKFVIIYSSDTDVNHPFQAPHVKHRRFSEWVKKNLSEWKLLRRIPNRYPCETDKRTGLCADFFIYGKT